MKRILVTGAGGSASYNYIMSLRNNLENEKFFIVGADTSKYHLELSPVDKRYIIPRANEINYIEKLNKLIKKEKIDFLHIQPDTEVAIVTKNKKKIETKTLLPKYHTLEICQNKIALNKFLRDKKIAVPDSFIVNSEEDLKGNLEILLKFHEKVWLRAIRGAGSRAALPVKTYEQAKMWIDYWKVMKGVGYGDFMISEFLPGKEYAFQSFWINGELIVSQARERLEYIFGNLTPSGQSSSPSVAVTISNKEVNNLASSAIKAIDSKATGIFCMDMKTDKNGKVKIIEINAGRFFTTSLFFSMAGINMPYIYTKIGLGEKFKKNWKKFDNLEANLYWIRMIDMGYNLIKENTWTSKKI